jgi:hypothetical protein
VINTRQLLALIAIPVLIGTFGCVAQDKTVAQSSNRLAQDSSQPNQQREGRRNHRGPDFAAAAQKLGISEADLKAALGVTSDSQGAPGTPGQRPRLDIKGAATKLGITEQQLVNALGIPPRPPRADLAAAAQKLGVSEANLKAALGVPSDTQGAPGEPGQGRPPRPDLKAAAAKLGVTEQQLVNALGIPPRPPQDGNQPNGSRPPQQ